MMQLGENQEDVEIIKFVADGRQSWQGNFVSDGRYHKAIVRASGERYGRSWNYLMALADSTRPTDFDHVSDMDGRWSRLLKRIFGQQPALSEKDVEAIAERCPEDRCFYALEALNAGASAAVAARIAYGTTKSAPLSLGIGDVIRAILQRSTDVDAAGAMDIAKSLGFLRKECSRHDNYGIGALNEKLLFDIFDELSASNAPFDALIVAAKGLWGAAMCERLGKMFSAKGASARR